MRRDLFFLPGAACPARTWEAVAEPLGAHANVHYVEVPGFAGLPPGEGSPLGAVEQRLVREVSIASAPATLLAHSLGCFVAYRVAATLGEQVAAVVVVDGPPALGSMTLPQLSDVELAIAMRRRADGLARLSTSELSAHLRSAFAPMVRSGAALESLLERAERSDACALATAMYEAWSTDLRPLLQDIRAPVMLVLPGVPEQDASRREKAYRQQLAALSRLTVEVVAGARHFVMLDQPRELLALVTDFLQRHGALDVA